ncbi:BolA protein [Pontibaca methylaminivorans]|uniref:BolA protein n=1 Tax=Pontibaca methylaminivorans TaxID=515897 RepID=A0A1R3WH66_9RHOB|nr:BolA protein [Pontibaca methylaminivorans]
MTHPDSNPDPISVTAQIRGRLEAAFSPRELEVADVSESHRGHAGYREGGESHFDVRIRAAAFEGRSRIARHRAVHDALGPELIGRIHALALDIGT